MKQKSATSLSYSLNQVGKVETVRLAQPESHKNSSNGS